MKRTVSESHYLLGPGRLTCSVLLGLLLTACAGDDAGPPDALGGATSTGGETGGSGGAGTTSGGAKPSGGAGTSSGGSLPRGGAGTSSGGQAVDAGFGNPCAMDADCPEFMGELVSYCGTIWPNGYCTATCNSFDDNQCGKGAVCDSRVGWCLKSCTVDSDCRDGYYCAEDSRGCERDFRP